MESETKVPFIDWLVPRRSEVQVEMLRLRHCFDEGRSSDEAGNQIWSLMLGASFSLWRAVFQANNNLEQSANNVKASDFLDTLIRNNAIAYSNELNSWSFGYYLNSARFRYIRAFDYVPESDRSAALRHAVARAAQQIINTSGRDVWVDSLKTLRLFLDYLEAKKRH